MSLMYKRLQGENLYRIRLSSDLLAIGSWDPLEVFELEVTQEPVNSMGWIYVNFTDNIKRDKIFFHEKNWTTLRYRRNARSNPTQDHEENDFVQINDVAEWINFTFTNLDDFWMVEDMWDNNAQIYWGNIDFWSNSIESISDSAITALTDWTHIAVFDYSDSTLKFVDTYDNEIHLILSTVTVSGWDITNIEDNRHTYVFKNRYILDRLEDQWGNLTYKGIPLGWGSGTWDVIGADTNVTVNEIVWYSNINGKIIKGLRKFFESSLTDDDTKVPTSEAVYNFIESTKPLAFQNPSPYVNPWNIVWTDEWYLCTHNTWSPYEIVLNNKLGTEYKSWVLQQINWSAKNSYIPIYNWYIYAVLSDWYMYKIQTTWDISSMGNWTQLFDTSWWGASETFIWHNWTYLVTYDFTLAEVKEYDEAGVLQQTTTITGAMIWDDIIVGNSSEFLYLDDSTKILYLMSYGSLTQTQICLLDRFVRFVGKNKIIYGANSGDDYVYTPLYELV